MVSEAPSGPGSRLGKLVACHAIPSVVPVLYLGVAGVAQPMAHFGV